MKLDQAYTIAETWQARLSPACDRIQIAGSVRREKPEVGDIEIVCIPKAGQIFDPLEALLNEFYTQGLCTALKNGSKYKKLALQDGIDLDLFIVQKETWAVQLTLRTGPAEFSHWIVTKKKYGGALPSNCRVKDGLVWKEGLNEPLIVPTEEDFLNFLSLGWVHPKDRLPGLPFKNIDLEEVINEISK